jgi:hypothetical protein
MFEMLRKFEAVPIQFSKWVPSRINQENADPRGVTSWLQHLPSLLHLRAQEHSAPSGRSVPALPSYPPRSSPASLRSCSRALERRSVSPAAMVSETTPRPQPDRERKRARLGSGPLFPTRSRMHRAADSTRRAFNRRNLPEQSPALTLKQTKPDSLIGKPGLR